MLLSVELIFIPMENVLSKGKVHFKMFYEGQNKFHSFAWLDLKGFGGTDRAWSFEERLGSGFLGLREKGWGMDSESEN